MTAERLKEIRARYSGSLGDHAMTIFDLLAECDALRAKLQVATEEVEKLSEVVNDTGLNYERLLSEAKTEAQKLRQLLVQCFEDTRSCTCLHEIEGKFRALAAIKEQS